MEYNEDIEIWNLFRNGSEKAVYLLHNRYYNDLTRYGLKITDDLAETKDLINQMFFDLWQSHTKLPEVNNPKAYVITCMKNKMLQARKKKAGLSIAPVNDIGIMEQRFSSSVEETIIELQEHETLRKKVEKVLETLTDRQRVLVKLRFIEELSYEEIAARLDISVRTVYNSIYESMKILRKEFDGSPFPQFAWLL